MQSEFDLKNPIHLLAIGFGSGLIKPAPGTWGTLAAIPFYWLIFQPLQNQWLAYALVLLLAFAFGVWICGRTADDIGVHDHSSIVFDEFVGYWICLFALPANATNIILAFVLFRFFDIVKPWPISTIDRRVKAGFGIMLDDVIAGLMACSCLHLLQLVL